VLKVKDNSIDVISKIVFQLFIDYTSSKGISIAFTLKMIIDITLTSLNCMYHKN